MGRLTHYSGDFFHVSDFGARGDGTGDDSPAMQAAIDAASVTGGEVLWRPGLYNMFSPLRVEEGANVTLRGAQQNAVKLRAVVPMGEMLAISSQWTSMQNLFLSGGNNAQFGIVFHDASRSYLSRVYVQTCESGFVWDNEYLAPLGNNNEIQLTQCYATLCSGDGYLVRDIQSDNNDMMLFNCVGQANAGSGLKLRGQGWKVIGGNFNNNLWGVEIGGESDDNVSVENQFIGVWFESNANGGIATRHAISSRNVAMWCLGQGYDRAGSVNNNFVEFLVRSGSTGQVDIVTGDDKVLRFAGDSIQSVGGELRLVGDVRVMGDLTVDGAVG